MAVYLATVGTHQQNYYVQLTKILQDKFYSWILTISEISRQITVQVSNKKKIMKI
jgi:hypothetical protein